MQDVVLDFIKRTADDVGIIAGWTAGITALCALAWHRKSPIRKISYWLFHRNVVQPVTGWASKTVLGIVEPLAEDIKAAAREQHEAQNANIDGIRTDLARHIEQHKEKP